MKSVILFGLLLSFIFNSQSFAGRPVFHTLDRKQLIEQSSFIFTGWPSKDKPVKNCANEMGRWWVHKVLKGDKNLEGKVIALADHKYEMHLPGKGVSYAANVYNTGTIDKSQGSSFLFTQSKDDGCFELTAAGAQESNMIEPEITALFSQDCSEAQRGFNFHIDQLPADCQQDSDCQIFYFNPNSCGKPFVLNKKTDGNKDTNLLQLQAVVRKNCGKDWEKQPACSPEVFPIHCEKNKCKEGPAKGSTAIKFLKGKIHAGCAPHDAGSKQILITDGKADFPIISINWWGPKQPQFAEGTYSLSGSPDMKNDFQATYCLYKGSCQTPKGVKLKIQWTKNNVTIEFTITLPDGEKVEGTVPLETTAMSERVLCG